MWTEFAFDVLDVIFGRPSGRHLQYQVSKLQLDLQQSQLENQMLQHHNRELVAGTQDQVALENRVAALRHDGAAKDANATVLRWQLEMERATVADLKKSARAVQKDRAAAAAASAATEAQLKAQLLTEQATAASQQLQVTELVENWDLDKARITLLLEKMLEMEEARSADHGLLKALRAALAGREAKLEQAALEASQAAEKRDADLQAARQGLQRSMRDLLQSRTLAEQLQAQLDSCTARLHTALLDNQRLLDSWSQANREKLALLQQLADPSRTLVVSEADCPLVRHLGSGACGSVDLHQMQMAVKKASTPQDQQVLHKESVALFSLDHPSIPKLLCFVARSDGTCGLGMNFISGGSLEEAIWPAREGTAGRSAFARPGICSQLWIMMQLVDVLMYAHSMGWVHADVKAANIMLTADGQVILIDWGLAYMISEPDKTWRGTIGTYQPANVLHGSSMGPKDDIRGLCTVGVNMLHGGNPVCIKLTQRYRAANANPAIRGAITDAIKTAPSANYEDELVRVGVAEILGYTGLCEADFAPLLQNARVPQEYVSILQRGLGHDAACAAEGAMPTLQEFGAVLQRAICEMEASQLPTAMPALND